MLDFHLPRAGERKGPYSEDSVRQFLANGELNGNELAWHGPCNPLENFITMVGKAHGAI
jgi:hypothetical protein